MMSHLYSSRGGNNESSIWDVASCLGRHTSSIWDATSCLGRHTSSIWDTTSWWLNLIEYSWEYSWPVRSDGPPKFGSSKKKLNQWKSRILDPTLRNDLMNDYRPSDMIGWSINFLSVQEKIEPMKIMNFLSNAPKWLKKWSDGPSVFLGMAANGLKAQLFSETWRYPPLSCRTHHPLPC